MLARDQEASEQLIQGIINRSLIPFFFSEEDYQHPASEWEKFFYPCQALPSITDYYYAIYEDHDGKHIINNEIYSYTTHQQS
jgi:hypothetical protein